MAIVAFDINKLKDAKTKINQINTQISSEMKLFDEELKNIPLILNTPKSSKNVPKYIEYFVEKEFYIKSQTNYFDTIMDKCINNYSQYLDRISKMVGEKYDK